MKKYHFTLNLSLTRIVPKTISCSEKCQSFTKEIGLLSQLSWSCLKFKIFVSKTIAPIVYYIQGIKKVNVSSLYYNHFFVCFMIHCIFFYICLFARIFDESNTLLFWRSLLTELSKMSRNLYIQISTSWWTVFWLFLCKKKLGAFYTVRFK